MRGRNAYAGRACDLLFHACFRPCLGGGGGGVLVHVERSLHEASRLRGARTGAAPRHV